MYIYKYVTSLVGLIPLLLKHFNISCKANLAVMDSSFCFSGKLLLSPSILNDNLAAQSILGCKFFHFISLTIFCQSFGDNKVSIGKSADRLMGISLAAFKIHFLPLTLNFLSFSVGVFQFIIGTHRDIWTQMSISFTRLGKFSAIVSSDRFSASLSLSLSLFFQDLCNVNVSTPDVVPEVSQTILIVFLFFSFCYAKWVISTILFSRSLL